MSEPAPSTHLRSFVRIIIVFIVVFDVAFLWQKLSGAHTSEFGGYPEEGAHCVTGLFIRDGIMAAVDFARSGFEGSPVKKARDFAAEFRAHYPRVLFGAIPPAFHVAEGIWTVPFGTSRLSFLLFMAFLAAIVATVTFEAVNRPYGLWAASGAALLWMCLPLVRESYGMLTPEMLSALLLLGAALAFGSYLDHGRKRDALWFSLCAVGAILTQAVGLVVLPMCMVAIVLRGSWKTLVRPTFAVALLSIGGVAGAWFWAFRGTLPAFAPNWDFTKEAAPFYGFELVRSAGVAVACFALIGWCATGRKNGASAALGSLVLTIFAFHLIVPARASAHSLLPATPALILLAITGVFAIARHARVGNGEPRVQMRREILWVVLLVILALPPIIRRFGPKVHEGFEGLAVELLQTAPPQTRILVCSDATGEGMFISELAMRDQRPNFFVERGSRSLTDPKARTGSGRQIVERFADDASLLDYLVRSKIGYIVLDAAVPEHDRAGYHDQLRRVIADNTGLFWQIVESPVRRDNEDLFPPLRLYRIVRENSR
jgi:hypothetical protein